MMQLLGQLLKLPFTAFVFGMEMLAKTMQGMQKLADEGIDAMIGGGAQTPGQTPGSPTPGQTPGSPSSPTSESITSVTDGAVQDSAETTPKEEIKMSDNSLSNDDVKVVEYYILTIKPDHEHILTGHFPEVKVFTDNMTGADFASWVIADYFQRPNHEPMLPGDKKYLRVCYDVVCTFKAEEANYDKEEVQVLREISRKLGPPVVAPE
jgi:hypothetical protein